MKIVPLAGSFNCVIVAYEIDNFWFLYMVEQVKSHFDIAKYVRAKNVGRGFVPKNGGSEIKWCFVVNKVSVNTCRDGEKLLL